MIIQRLTAVLSGLMVSGGLMAFTTAQPTTYLKQNSQPQHLSCVQDKQKLTCTIDKAANDAQQTASKADPSTSEAATVEPLGQVSDFLLGVIYFGLPIALAVAVIRHDQQAAERTRVIEQLERLWKQSSQH